MTGPATVFECRSVSPKTAYTIVAKTAFITSSPVRRLRTRIRAVSSNGSTITPLLGTIHSQLSLPPSKISDYWHVAHGPGLVQLVEPASSVRKPSGDAVHTGLLQAELLSDDYLHDLGRASIDPANASVQKGLSDQRRASIGGPGGELLQTRPHDSPLQLGGV